MDTLPGVQSGMGRETIQGLIERHSGTYHVLGRPGAVSAAHTVTELPAADHTTSYRKVRWRGELVVEDLHWFFGPIDSLYRAPPVIGLALWYWGARDNCERANEVSWHSEYRRDKHSSRRRLEYREREPLPPTRDSEAIRPAARDSNTALQTDG